eukprot:452913-Pyramimonas_sp.AAC.1
MGAPTLSGNQSRKGKRYLLRAWANQGRGKGIYRPGRGLRRGGRCATPPGLYPLSSGPAVTQTPPPPAPPRPPPAAITNHIMGTGIYIELGPISEGGRVSASAYSSNQLTS